MMPADNSSAKSIWRGEKSELFLKLPLVAEMLEELQWDELQVIFLAFLNAPFLALDKINWRSFFLVQSQKWFWIQSRQAGEPLLTCTV